MFVLTNGVKQYYLLWMVFELISQCNNMIVHWLIEFKILWERYIQPCGWISLGKVQHMVVPLIYEVNVVNYY